MSVRIGFDHYTIAHRGLSAEETLEFASTHGFDGVQFLAPEAIDSRLDTGHLAAFRQRAERLELYLEVGLTSPNPVRRSRQEGREITPGELAHDLARQLEATAVLNCSHARAYIGDRHDRFRTDISWNLQRQATLEVLRQLIPQLRELGIRVALETHADVTVTELLAVVRELGPEVAGVTFDTGNIMMRLDEPVRAAEQLADWVLGTHVKDAVLAFTPRGLCWQARPVGSGIVPMPDVLAPLIHAKPDLALSIELHPRTYDLPIFDRSWLAFFPDLSAAALAEVVRIATVCEARYADGSLERPEAVEKVAWKDRDLDGLASSLGYLRTVARGLVRLDGQARPHASEPLPGDQSPSSGSFS